MIRGGALPVEFPGYPAIAVTGKLFNDGFDAAGKCRLVKGFLLAAGKKVPEMAGLLSLIKRPDFFIKDVFFIPFSYEICYNDIR